MKAILRDRSGFTEAVCLGINQLVRAIGKRKVERVDVWQAHGGAQVGIGLEDGGSAIFDLVGRRQDIDNLLDELQRRRNWPAPVMR